MKKLNVISIIAALLGFALANTAVAQTQDFPRERTTAASCANVDWNDKMLQFHPSLISACREVIVVNGKNWARFTAKLVRVEPNGNVIFSVLNTRDRSIEEVLLVPTPGQVAYINDRPTPFGNLRTTDTISLYVPDGQYGFAMKPGVAPEQLAKVMDPAASTRPASTMPVTATETMVAQRTVVAQRDTSRPTILPKTAGPLPWLALGGFLSLLGGLGLTTLRRWS